MQVFRDTVTGQIVSPAALLIERVIENRDRVTRETEYAMRHEGSNEGRGQVDHVGSSVNATEVRVTPRLRVRRNDAWQDSYLELSRDTERNHAIRKGMQSECISIRVPTWYLAAVGTEKAANSHRHLGHVFTAPEQEKTAKQRSRPTMKLSEVRAAKLRAIAGTIRMGEQD